METAVTLLESWMINFLYIHYYSRSFYLVFSNFGEVVFFKAMNKFLSAIKFEVR